MKRRDFLLTSSAAVATALVPVPSIAKAPVMHTGGVVIGRGTLTFGSAMFEHINCRCVISPELAGRNARHQLKIGGS